MDKNEGLTGTWVLVHPDLDFDAVARQGQLGMLTYADIDKDEYYASFGKDVGLYSGDSLMVLKNSNDIYAEAMANVKTLEKEQLKVLMRMSLLAATGLPPDKRSAMELAAMDKVARSYALESLEEKFNRELAPAADQELAMGGSRGR